MSPSVWRVLARRQASWAGISTDFFGHFLAQTLSEAGVSLRYAARLPQGSTLAFVKLGDHEPQYAFYDRETAMRSWTRAAAPPVGEEVSSSISAPWR